MKVNHVNAVCRAAKGILSSHFGLDVEYKTPVAGANAIPSNDVSVVLGVNGEVNGQIVCAINEQTAKNIVGMMMGGMTIEKLDDMYWSAIQEFGNWVAGSTATELSKENCLIDVTPPMVNDGQSNYRSSEQFITVPLASSLGLIDIHISLYQKAS
ncbi:chemotaxis protein CheX [Alteribacter keqinensis]|uniref:Chemotaxis protein CheX n=1 Tax=Alteribacter keqinensis TaxID=2483800 RepID=A0A3M7TY57_9BACI|nr:chemotaxis protein CheX [Alteribacter keqinensis]RNA70528.1 chemotaxis protein CheX [Alteribacter keqinensis]